MYTLFVIVHLIASAVLILVVLLQSGKAGDLASAFGGSGSQTAFGSRGAATLLSKATTACAVLFMITSLGLSILAVRSTGTVMEGVPVPEPVPAATAPGQEQQPQTQPPAQPEAPPSSEATTPPPTSEPPPESR